MRYHHGWRVSAYGAVRMAGDEKKERKEKNRKKKKKKKKKKKNRMDLHDCRKSIRFSMLA